MENIGLACGAIAYDRQSGAFDYSFQKSDADTASASALGFCSEHGDACEIMVIFSDA